MGALNSKLLRDALCRSIDKEIGEEVKYFGLINLDCFLCVKETAQVVGV